MWERNDSKNSVAFALKKNAALMHFYVLKKYKGVRTHTSGKRSEKVGKVFEKKNAEKYTENKFYFIELCLVEKERTIFDAQFCNFARRKFFFSCIFSW